RPGPGTGVRAGPPGRPAARHRLPEVQPGPHPGRRRHRRRHQDGPRAAARDPPRLPARRDPHRAGRLGGRRAARRRRRRTLAARPATGAPGGRERLRYQRHQRPRDPRGGARSGRPGAGAGRARGPGHPGGAGGAVPARHPTGSGVRGTRRTPPAAPAVRPHPGRTARAARPGTPPSAVAAAPAHHRTHFEHRAVLPAADRDTLLTALRSLAAGTPDPDLVAGTARARTRGKVAFVLPGQGSQWTGMARDLLVHDPVFADELDRCDAALRPHTGWSVTAVLRGDDGAPSLGRVDAVQPALFAVMVSLAAVWRARGVEPDAVIGHSQGEVAAACIAGALSLNDAAAVVALRGQALTGLSGTGTMAV